MADALMPMRCLPRDFVNPFLPYRVLPTICAVLLVAAAGAFYLTMPADVRAGSRRWQLRGVLGAAAWSVFLAAWVWLQSRFYVPSCGIAPFGDWRLGVQEFGLQVIPIAIQLTVIGTGVLLVVMVSTILYRLLHAR